MNWSGTNYFPNKQEDLSQYGWYAIASFHVTAILFGGSALST